MFLAWKVMHPEWSEVLDAVETSFYTAGVAVLLNAV